MKAFLIDNLRCVGCRACMVACKQWNNLKSDHSRFFAGPGYQNPRGLNENTFTLITYNELETDGRMNWVFGNLRCMHCKDPGCVSACPVGALEKTELGAVIWHASKCIGCRYCMFACPFNVPTFEWRGVNPEIRKCTMCYDRIIVGEQPACVKVCPTNSIQFGERDQMAHEAESRLRDNPARYYPRIYGKDEVGGTSVLILSEVPFDKLKYPNNLPAQPLPEYTRLAMKAIPPVVLGLGIFLGFTYRMVQRRETITAARRKGDKS